LNEIIWVNGHWTIERKCPGIPSNFTDEIQGIQKLN
jgi:hypothetical protein